MTLSRLVLRSTTVLNTTVWAFPRSLCPLCHFLCWLNFHSGPESQNKVSGLDDRDVGISGEYHTVVRNEPMQHTYTERAHCSHGIGHCSNTGKGKIFCLFFLPEIIYLRKDKGCIYETLKLRRRWCDSLWLLILFTPYSWAIVLRFVLTNWAQETPRFIKNSDA